MKYNILFLSLIIYSCSSINNNQTTCLNSYNDSIKTCTNEFITSGDTTLLFKAIGYCDTVMKKNLPTDERYGIMQKKCQLLGLVGKYRESFILQGEAVKLLDANDIRRLEYYGLKYKFEGDSAKSVAYLNKAINECNKNLSEKHNVIKKAEILIKLERYNEAKDALGAYLHNNDDDEVKMLLENFNMLKDEILQGEQLLYEKIALLTR